MCYHQAEVLDLKTEVCSLKNKMLQSEQKLIEEISSKSMFINSLE